MALDSPTCKNAHFPSRFPTKLSFSCMVLWGAFCPASFLMGTAHKALSFWTALWSVLSVLWLSSQSDSQIECTNGSGGGPASARALLLSLSVPLLPLPDLSALSFFIFSPLLVFCMRSFQWPHRFVCTLCGHGRRSADGQTSYILYCTPFKSSLRICLRTRWHLNNQTRAAANDYFNHRLVCQSICLVYKMSNRPKPKKIQFTIMKSSPYLADKSTYRWLWFQLPFNLYPPCVWYHERKILLSKKLMCLWLTVR